MWVREDVAMELTATGMLGHELGNADGFQKLAVARRRILLEPLGRKQPMTHRVKTSDL